MKKRHLCVVAAVLLAICTVTPLIAQSRPTVDAPADSFGRRVKVTAQGTGNAPSGVFQSGDLQIGGRPEPYSFNQIALNCEFGPYPSGFDVDLVNTRTDVGEFRIRFRAANNCLVPAKTGTPYNGTASLSSSSGSPLVHVLSQKYTGCEQGSGSVTINRFDIYGRKNIGAFFEVGYLNASFSFTCSNGDVSGTIEYSQDQITPDLVLLDPSGGETPQTPEEGGGGTTPAPPPDAFAGFPSTILESGLEMTNDSTRTVEVTTITQNSFAGDVTLDVITDGLEQVEGLTATLSRNSIASPGVGTSILTIKAGKNTLPRDYFVTVVTTANEKQAFNSIRVRVLCDPPMILGVDQPRSASFSGSGSATLEANATGSGPFTYQWYTGPRGSTNYPVSGGTNPRLTTNQEGLYWVRVSNACGTADSVSAFVTRQ